MKKRVVVTFFLFLMFGFGSVFADSVQLDKQTKQSLDIAVVQVLEAFKTQDQKVINTLINQEIGLYIIFRRGIMDEFIHVDSINLKSPVPEYLPYDTVEKKYYSLRYKKAPIFSCETEKWSDWGLIVDVDNRYNVLAGIATVQKEYNEINYTTEEIARYKNIDKQSLKVVATADNFVFYMIFIDGKWYLSILDRVEYCSA
jgi:hypothetical protein